MSEASLNFSLDEDGNRIVLVEGAPSPAGDLPGLVAAVPSLKRPAGLAQYCDALNYYARGLEYRVIHDPNAYRGRYERKLRAEDPNQPWQEGVPRLSDFGVCDTSRIEAPEIVGESVVFFVEHDFLGIPYRVTGPAPGNSDGEIAYEPLPMEAES